MSRMQLPDNSFLRAVFIITYMALTHSRPDDGFGDLKILWQQVRHLSRDGPRLVRLAALMGLDYALCTPDICDESYGNN